MLQKSEGGALGMGGGGMSGFMTGRSTANLLTRTTAILGAAFFASSIYSCCSTQTTRGPRSIIDRGGPVPTAPLPPNARRPVSAKPAPASPVPAIPRSFGAERSAGPLSGAEYLAENRACRAGQSRPGRGS